MLNFDTNEPELGLRLPWGIPPSLSVAQVTRHVADLIASDVILADVWVRGEIVQPSRPSSGHLYFTLKDEDAVLGCAMWRSYAARLRFRPEAGMSVLAHGRIEIYERTGKYQLIVDEIEPDGVGSLFIAFEQLKARLQGEGLFDEERKRSLPEFPRHVGVVTSPSGAALRDICATMRRGTPCADITIIPAQVQGAAAAVSIATAIECANRAEGLDLLIVGRGGGSPEDLWCFNEERTVRAVAASRLPVISAVGHETDFTLTDFVADYRAATPTAAAEAVVQRRDYWVARFLDARRRLPQALEQSVSMHRLRLEGLLHRPALARPGELIEIRRARVEQLMNRLAAAGSRSLERHQHQAALLAGRLSALNPLEVMARGYARVSRVRDGEPVRSVADAELDDEIRLALADGWLEARVVRRGEGETE